MKKSLTKIVYLSFAFLLMTQVNIFAQKNKNGISRPGVIITCPSSGIDEFKYTPPPAAFLEARKNGRVEGTANFEVTYIDFPNDAKNAVQFAIDIWSTLIASDQTIHIQITWAPQTGNTLASAGASSAFRDFEGAPRSGTWYGTPLAEKLAGRDFNDGEPDIVSTVNSGANWYLGTDGNTPSGQIDIVSVMLHEIGHGLGFSDSFNVDGGTATSGFESNDGNSYNLIYDHFLETVDGKNLLNGNFPTGSQALRGALLSNNLFFNSPASLFDFKKGDGIERAKAYAPFSFSRGSSIAHLDEAKYPAGSPHSLMSPQIGNAESIHLPGPITLGIFADMGWILTDIVHIPIEDLEKASNVVVNATIKSDTTYSADSLELHYSLDGFATEEAVIVLTATGNSDEFTTNFPPLANGEVSYYLSVVDGMNRTIKKPYTGAFKPYSFTVGPDTEAPIILHDPVLNVSSKDTKVEILAEVTDNFTLASVMVEYAIDGVEQTPFELLQQSDTSGNITNFYAADMILDGQENTVTYRIIATDSSVNANQVTHPLTGRHEIKVQTIAEVRESYFNDFNVSSDDFFGDYTIEQVDGFDNATLNTENPYKNGNDANDESNYIEQLAIPIRIKADRDSSIITFQEVVLVEPATAGNNFGDAEFWDYVIVEGSIDNGETWKAFLDGYDANAQSSWASTYNRVIVEQNSTALGSKSLFFERKFNMQDAFNAGDIVLIRFRLFADQAAHGWGWAIDDLNIQFGVKPDPPVGIDDDTSSNQEINVFPNPTNGTFQLDMELNSAVKDVKIVITDMVGREVFKQNYTNSGLHFEQSFDIQNIPQGMYLINVYLDNQKVTKKLLIK